MDPIWDYIIDGSLPDDPKEEAKIRARSARFTNHKGSLYKRGFFTPILKCIAGKDTEYVLREVHESICGNHIRARALAGKVLRQGYYWPTILKDATDLVKKCRICQEHAKISRLPSEPLTSITSPWPFQQWGLDILGPLPLGKGQCKFIIVAVVISPNGLRPSPWPQSQNRRYATSYGEPSYAGLVSREPCYQTTENNSTTSNSDISVPSSELRILTRL